MYLSVRVITFTFPLPLGEKKARQLHELNREKDRWSKFINMIKFLSHQQGHIL